MYFFFTSLFRFYILSTVLKCSSLLLGAGKSNSSINFEGCVIFFVMNLLFLKSRHCKRLAPTWDELSEKGYEGVTVAKVDCTKAKDACGAEGIRGYPTLQLYKDGKMSQKYSGARTMEALESFVVAQGGSLNAAEQEL
jgi:hypothetical protein